MRYGTLIGNEDDQESLKKYSEELLKKFILHKLQYFPNSSKVLDNWIVVAGDLFESVIMKNVIPITDMPPVYQNYLNEFKEEDVLKTIQDIRKKYWKIH